MKKFFTYLILLMCLIDVGFMPKLFSQTATLPYTQNFSTGNDLTFINGSATNKWVVGSATGNAANSMYVSNDNGTTNAYTNTATSVVFAYRDITIPAGATNATFSFDWKGVGEGGYDYLRVWLVPATFTPTAGTQITAGAGRIQVGGDLNQQTTWQNYNTTALNISTFAGSTMRLVFEWRNDDIVGTSPAAAVDNISLLIPTCVVPSALVVPTITPNSATLGWTAPSPAPANGYEYYYSTSSTPPVAATAGTAISGTSVSLSPLVPGTTYYWWVRAVCSATDKSTWAAGPAFTPGQIGSGTGTTGNLPVYSCYGYNYSQQIYTAAEVAGAVGTNNYITSIRFYVSATAATQANYNQWVVYMGNTTQANFATTTSWVPLANMSQVYSGTLPNMTSGTWVEIPLSTPFLWNGTSNIVIAVDENVAGYSCTANWGSYAAGTNRGILYYNDTTNPNPASPPTASSRYSDIPRVQLVGVNLQPCTTAPPANIVVNNLTPTSATVSWTPSLGATYVVRYRVAPSGPWITVNVTAPLSNSYTITGLNETTQYEVQVATVCGGTTGAFSASSTFTTPAISYCTAGPTSTTVYEYMSNVTVTPNGLAPMVSNSSTPPPFYTDYSADPTRLVTLIRGQANNSISVTKVWPGTSYSAGTKAWIDWNRNGIFETTEVVLDSPSNTTSVVNNTFTVPTLAQGVYAGTQNIKMRVILQEGGTPNACGTFTWGEVEDYNVKLIDLLPCTTAPPTNVTVSGLTATTANVSWLPTAGATYIIRWRVGATGPWLPSAAGQTLPAGQSYYTITGLTEQTGYQVQIATICSGTTGAFGASTTFTTPTLSYCPMTGTGTNDYISNVTVTPTNLPVMNNTSVQTNYISYTTPATLINLEIGSANNKISVEKSWIGATYSDAVSAWIDYNRNGIFETTEQILNSAASTVTPITNLNFTVPATAYNGPLNTTMRVVLKRTSAPVLCQNATDGEVEDYAVKLRPCSNATPGAPSFSAVTHNSATINWTGATSNLNYILQYRVQGTTAWTSVNVSTLAGNPPVTITGLTPATTYEVQVAAICGATPGTYTAIKTFKTRCDPTPPNVTVSNITSTSAVITWNPLVPSATYVLRWRIVGTTTWNNVTLPLPPANTYTLTGLSSFVTYEVQVANICNGETTPNTYSNPQVFTTVRICELPPPGLTISAITPTSAVVNWDAFPGATYILRYRKVGIPSWTTIPVATNTYTLTGLLELTKYEMQVVNVCNGTPGNYTPPYFFTTPTITYCQMSSSASASDYISKVTVTPTGKPVMASTTLASNYSDFTGVPAKFIEMIQGSANNQISIEKKTGATTNTGVAVWIDFNRNGYFDINEKVLSSGPNTNATVSGTFNVPTDAYVSNTNFQYVVMRVAMQKDGIPVNCTNFQTGEVEDYTVRISKVPVVNPVNQTDILIYPNPVSSILNVKNISKKANYKIYTAGGQLVSSGVILNNKIDVSKLINGLYVLDIEDAQGSIQKKFIKE